MCIDFSMACYSWLLFACQVINTLESCLISRLVAWEFVNVLGNTQLTFGSPTTSQKFMYSSLFPSWNGAMQFSVGVWSKRITFPDSGSRTILQLSNNPS